MRSHLCLIVFVLIALAMLSAQSGCDNQPGLRDVSQRVVNVDETDEAMNAAIAKAKKTFYLFEKNWQNTDVEEFSIKLAMETESDGLEHIWFTPIKIADGQITATCANDPEGIPELQFGDVRTVDQSKVSDWMIMAGGKCYGGYTIRVLSEQDPANAPPLEFADFPQAP